MPLRNMAGSQDAKTLDALRQAATTCTACDFGQEVFGHARQRTRLVVERKRIRPHRHSRSAEKTSRRPSMISWTRSIRCWKTTPRSSWRTTFSAEASSDSQAPVGSVSTLLAQAGSEDRQAAQPGHLQHPRGGGATRAGRAVLQTARVTVLGKTGRHRRRGNDLLPRLGERRLSPLRSRRPTRLIDPRSEAA